MRQHHRKARQLEPGTPSRGLPAPSFDWVAGPGAWEEGAGRLKAWGPLGLVGEAGLLQDPGAPLKAALNRAGVPFVALARTDGSDCTAGACGALAAEARRLGLKALLGFGGGRMIDLAKAAAFKAGLPCASAPASAATCACATAVAVLNRAEGGFAEVLDLAGPPVLVLAQDGVLQAAPPRLLAAGLADTLAKWLEWRAIPSAEEHASAEAAALQGWREAGEAFEACRALGKEALAGPGEARAAVLDACLRRSGLASCLGQAPAAAAHSLANALSRQAPGAALLHGEAVGLGLLWQEALLEGSGRENMEVTRLKALLGSWGLPLSLPAGVDLDRLLVEALSPGETVHLLGLGPAVPGAREALLPLLP